jgi:flagellar assembly protein FliH
MSSSTGERSAERRQSDRRLVPFIYRPAPGWSATAVATNQNETTADESPFPEAVSTPIHGASQAEDEARAREMRARELGFREGALQSRAEAEALVRTQREAIVEAVRSFATARQDYFARIEGEVVALALAIARKVLHRESQVDPLLLTGLVRVALEKMKGGDDIRLRVHPSQISAWRDYFKEHAVDLPTPDFLGDNSLGEGQCQLETAGGATTVNLEGQLKEIEQGLFDLLAQRPVEK